MCGKRDGHICGAMIFFFSCLAEGEESNKSIFRVREAVSEDEVVIIISVCVCVCVCVCFLIYEYYLN